MRIAILYICTGRYTIFWDVFFRSCEIYFLPQHERHYFVFTDGKISHTENERVCRMEQPHLGWPFDTLKRFHIFSRIRETLHDFDYIFFFNANCEFCMPIDESILPSAEEGIVVTRHPGFYDKPRDKFTYDNNPASRAYIPAERGEYYVCGGVNGGRASAYIALIDDPREAVDEDERNGVMALWHDESHLNRYILDRPHKLLPPSYCNPEGWNLPFDEIIRIRDKVFKHGGLKFLRQERESFASRAIGHLKILFPPDSPAGKAVRRLRSMVRG